VFQSDHELPSNADNRVRGTFSSLGTHNYRLWMGGTIVSSVGGWMQRTAQDWLVLTELTHHNATAMGVVMALQALPQLLLLPWSGYAADHFNRRKLLLLTQTAMAVLALALGLLILSGLVRLWHVYMFAFLLGCVTAFDTPARQTFITELVAEHHLANAVALNSTAFHSARLIGPAIAGIMIAAMGSGWAFLINAASFAAVIGSILLLRTTDLHHAARSKSATGGLADGARYVWSRPDLRAVMLMMFLLGTFGMNYPLFIATMSVSVFHVGADRYGLLTSIMAVGSVAGALLAAARTKPGMMTLASASIVFGIGFALSAIMPDYWLFGLMLSVVGIAAQTIMTTANSMMHLSTDRAMRGRVIAIFLAVILAGMPIGAPIIGWVADRFGARAALAVGAATGFVAAGVWLRYLYTYRRLRVSIGAGHFRVSVKEPAQEALP
jgi:MFS family permease